MNFLHESASSLSVSDRFLEEGAKLSRNFQDSRARLLAQLTAPRARSDEEDLEKRQKLLDELLSVRNDKKIHSARIYPDLKKSPVSRPAPRPAARPVSVPPRRPRAASVPRATSQPPLALPSRRDFRETVRGWEIRKQLQLRERAELRKKLEIEETKECTFQPSVGSKQTEDETVKQASAMMTSERLYQESKRRVLERERAAALKRAQLLATPTTPPAQFRAPNVPGYIPIELRAEKERTDKEERVNRLRAEVEAEQLPFHPVVGDKSRELAERRAGAGLPVELRLFPDKSSKNLQPNSPKLKRSSSAPPPEFLARQTAFLSARDKKISIVSQINHKECTFAPRLTARSEALLAARGRFPSHDHEAVTRRVAIDCIEERRVKLADLRSKVLAEQVHSFRPKIDEISDALVAHIRNDQRPVHERLFQEANEQKEAKVANETHRDWIERRAEELAANNANIKGSKNPLYEHVSAHYDFNAPETILTRIKAVDARKQQELRKAREDREREVLKECTFEPRVADDNQSERSNPIVVRGLDRFYELKRSAALQKADRTEREKRVGGGYSGRRALAVTVPIPFNLTSTSSPKLSHPKLFKFRPETLQSNRSRVVDSILNNY